MIVAIMRPCGVDRSKVKPFHGDDVHAPRLELLQRVQEIENASAPARKLGDQHGIDFAPLSERDHLFPLGAIELRARAGFFEYAEHLVAGAGGEGGQIALLPGAGLIGGRYSAIKGGALSQLNSLRLTGRNPLSLFGLTTYRTALTLFGTIRHAETPRCYPRAARGAACLTCHRN
jgi:hypothetical protein